MHFNSETLRESKGWNWKDLTLLIKSKNKWNDASIQQSRIVLVIRSYNE
jgi:hypothetical protein